MLEKTKHHIHISSKRRWFDFNLKEVWNYRDLIMLLTKRNFAIRYKQTILGPIWLFITPIISSLIYTFIFGGIAGIDTEGVPQLLFFMSGNAIWIYFSSCVTKNASTFISNANMFGKVYFPRLVTPISNMLTSFIEFGIQIIVVLAFFFYFISKHVVHPHWEMWPFIPIILFHLGVMGLGCGIIISSLTTKYRDLSILVGFGVQLWMYITPVVYPLAQTDNKSFRVFLMINPVTAPVEAFRYAFLGKGTIVPWALLWSWTFTLFVLFLGIMIFNYVEKTFMDTV